MPGILRGRSLADDAPAPEPPRRAGDAIPIPVIARKLAEDTRTGTIGEVMPSAIPEHLLDPSADRTVSLRPVGGGCEWSVPEAFIRPVTARFTQGDVVRVRDEAWLSVITQPTDGPPTCDPDLLPEVSVCCVPIALVRPLDDPDGALRWVEIADLTAADTEPVTPRPRPAYFSGPSGLVPDHSRAPGPQ